MFMMASLILKSAGFIKTENLDILRTKHYFFLQIKNSLITLQALLDDKE